MNLREKTGHFFEEVWRMRWPLIICVAVAFGRDWGYMPRTSQSVIWLSGLAKMFLGAIAAHVFVQQAFPYMDQRGLLFRALGLVEFESLAVEDRTLAAWAFVGCAVLRGLIYAAAMLSGSQALG